jgi:putative ABC transport system permease protein
MFMKWPEIIARSSAVQQRADRLWRRTLRPFLARGVRRAQHYSLLATEVCSLVLARQPVVPLVVKLAAKNLFHDRVRFIATLIGIVFSIVLVSVQMGLFLSFGRMVTTMIDHAPADLWIMPLGTKCFEDPSLLDERERFRAMAVKGVSDAVPILISFAQWRVPSGGSVPVLVIGANLRTAGLRPWNIFEGNLDSLSIPDAVAIDRSYFGRLGSKGLGDTAEIRDQRAQVRVVTTGIRSFTPRPTYSRRSIGREPIPRPRLARPRICLCILPRAPTWRRFAAD